MIKQLFQDKFKKLTGLSIYKKLPFGIDPYDDLKLYMKGYQFKTFFDVGANYGQTAKDIHKSFPHSKIYCFEPFSKTYEALKYNVSHIGVSCYQIALGSVNDTVEVAVDRENNGFSDLNSLIHIPENPDNIDHVEQIEVWPLTTFCRSHAISHIDYLKIDTEGYDLEVLKGGTDMLKDQSIAFIEIETGINPENTYHVAFPEIKSFLEKYGYRVYGIYGQRQEWPSNTPVLRRVNALFVSQNTCENIQNYMVI